MNLRPFQPLWVVAIWAFSALGATAAEPPRTEDFLPVAQEIDRRLAAHWESNRISPAAPADDATLVRRLSLDLAGRIPTRSEWESRLTKPLAERYPQLVQELLAGPEFSLYWGAVLDELLQGPSAGNAEFTDYLRRSVRAGKSWDAIFRELMIGPWDTAENKPATRFLELRAKDLDRLTTDATRVFFGVDVSCARCHDHPLVEDWKQDHYYGMASFFNRTTSGGKGSVGEKNDGDVSFKNALGEQKTARVMFLSGSIAEPPPPAEGAKPAKVSRREQLVSIALSERTFLSRSIVNRLWRQLLGRGLVHPVDQMHSGNPASVPGLLEWLADDFANSGYNLRRLVGAIVTSRAYRLSSQWEQSGPPPAEGDFAVMRLGLLSPRQYAMSVLVATGRAGFADPDAAALRAESLVGASGVNRVTQYLAAEQQMTPLLPSLDPGHDGQTSTAEALFLSNNAVVQALVQAEENMLAAQLTVLDDPQKIADSAIRSIYCRSPTEQETSKLASWLSEQGSDKRHACERLVWVLLTSAEFRFKH